MRRISHWVAQCYWRLHYYCFGDPVGDKLDETYRRRYGLTTEKDEDTS